MTAWQSPSVAAGQTCQAQTRTCTNGVLSGTHQYATCSVQTGGTTGASCTLGGITVQNGQSHTFYSGDSVQSPNTCATVSQVRTCTNGTLSGSAAYNKASCIVTGSTSGGSTGKLSAQPTSGTAPLTVTFSANVVLSASGNLGSPGATSNYKIVFGDGSEYMIPCVPVAIGTCQGGQGPHTVSHTYAQNGTYSASLWGQWTELGVGWNKVQTVNINVGTTAL